ncbi:HDOD domain-containing protein [Ideonella sp. A 288]|uniref:HDOD domain-containing protein n=1 Tax=Ideonella sp. A 288 TaxID=1962181 RepID=UPI000B4AD2F8|nr:HDOD domain-containing protein [Ideonella sp. A 288]
MSLEALFSKPAALPIVPKVVQELILSFGREDASVGDIAAKLASDPVLGAKTLRLANSAYFHVSRQIATVDDALRMLGFVMVRNLVVACGVAGAFKPMRGIDLPQFWRHSLHTACTARWLAPAGGLNADLAFTVGLVHALGQLVMHVAQPEAMVPIDAQCHPLAAGRAALESATLGYHHGAVSAGLAARWKFPAEMVDPLRGAVDPLHTDPPSPMAALIHIAAWRARIDSLSLDAAEAADSCPQPVAHVLGLDLQWLPDLATVGVEHDALPPHMPPLAELTMGLEAMLH